MKNTFRVHKHGAKPLPSSQAQTAPGPDDSLELPSGDCHPTCLALFDRLVQKPVSKIPLSEDECNSIFQRSYENRLSYGQFVADAIREKSRCADKRRYYIELNRAKDQTFAVLRLIEDHIYATRDDTERNDAKHIMFEVGLHELIASTWTRLERAVHLLS